MWHRYAAILAVALVFVVAAPTSAQQNSVYSKAVPPNKVVLERLNLKTEWVQFIPVEGRRDTLTQIQTLDDQVFVQTRTGYFFAIDALTGRIQWTARLGNGTYSNSYPVAANSRFVFVANVTKLYAFYRYTGMTEFVTDLGAPPTTGLACDETGVYCVLGMRSGNAGAHRIAVYDLPRPIALQVPAKGPIDPLTKADKSKAINPVDDLLSRYNSGFTKIPPLEELEPIVRPQSLQAPIGGAAGSKTPSLSTLHSVVPPYTMGNRSITPSLSTLPTMRPPYHLRQESGKYIQQTPSIGVIPPSVAASLQLSDLRPKGIEPPLRWEYGVTANVLYPLTLTPTRAWAVLDGNRVLALNKESEAGKVITEVRDQLPAAIAAPPAQAGLTNYIPLANGTLAAIDAAGGTLEGGATVKWRADTGGINNHTPFVTSKYVYAAGDDSGVMCINRGTGDIVWRSESKDDRMIGANEEFAYIRDREGRFFVFDAKRATEPVSKRSVPLGSANLSEFNINIVNTVSDRVYLSADNGLIVCIRDAAPKYTKPMRIWPPAEINSRKKIGVESQPAKDGMIPAPKKEMEPKPEGEPKKELNPKKEPEPKMP